MLNSAIAGDGHFHDAATAAGHTVFAETLAEKKHAEETAAGDRLQEQELAASAGMLDVLANIVS